MKQTQLQQAIAAWSSFYLKPFYWQIYTYKHASGLSLLSASPPSSARHSDSPKLNALRCPEIRWQRSRPRLPAKGWQSEQRVWLCRWHMTPSTHVWPKLRGDMSGCLDVWMCAVKMVCPKKVTKILQHIWQRRPSFVCVFFSWRVSLVCIRSLLHRKSS